MRPARAQAAGHGTGSRALGYGQWLTPRTCLAGYKYWSLQYPLVETSSSTSQVQPELAPETAEVLQAATRVLAGVALRSLDVLDGAVTLPQFRMLAVLADLGGPGPLR